MSDWIGSVAGDLEQSAKDCPTCEGREYRPRVFCASLADVFEDWNGRIDTHDGGALAINPDGQWMAIGRDAKRCPSGSEFATLNDVRSRLFRLIDSTPCLDWLLLTKRPENVRRMWMEKAATGNLDPVASAPYGSSLRLRRENVWLGTSIACQEDADRNVPELLKFRNLAAKLFLSIEPLAGPVDISSWIGCFHESSDPNQDDHSECAATANWVIVGGESGPNARPCDIAWIRSIVRQCKDAGVPVFVKQLGALPLVPLAPSDDHWPGMHADPRGRSDGMATLVLDDPKGGDHAEWPEDLRVREVPA